MYVHDNGASLSFNTIFQQQGGLQAHAKNEKYKKNKRIIYYYGSMYGKLPTAYYTTKYCHN